MLQRRYQKRIQATLNFYARKNHLKVYRFQNVGNHLHIVLQGRNLQNYSAFIKAFSGRIAQVMLREMGFERMGGNPNQKASVERPKFWDYRPFSRVVGWGKDFAIMKDYILKNTLDVLGLARTSDNLQQLKESIRILRAQGPPASDLEPLGKIYEQQIWV